MNNYKCKYCDKSWTKKGLELHMVKNKVCRDTQLKVYIEWQIRVKKLNQAQAFLDK
jgi:hypothetical protein